ncbi:Epimerase family protein OS=Tsukamurella paurometabola OX=2061 GN=NCTC10741_03393 PE=4 SV=1 [Tsukamurella paurometabola]
MDLPDGVVVAAAPHLVRNAELMRELRRHLHRPPAPPTPAPVLAVGAIAMRSDPALGLTGRHATSAVLPAAGFVFRHPRIDGALADLLG